MKVIKKYQENNKIVVEIESDSAEWKKAQQNTRKNLHSNIRVPGFRPGKAPANMVNISNQEVVYKAVDKFANKMINEFIETTQNDEEYDTILQESLKTSLKSMNENEVVLKLEFDFIPNVDVQGYNHLNLNFPSNEVSDEEVETEFNKIVKKDQMLVPKENDSTVQNGDSVNFDFTGKKDGVAFEGGSAKEYEMVIGSGQFIPGFEEQMVGMKTGEEKAINVSFPSDYHAKDLAGAPVTFDVKVNSISALQNPEFDEDYFKKFNIENVKTDIDLKNYLRGQLVDWKKETSRENVIRQINEQILADIKLEHIPESLLISEKQRLTSELQTQADKNHTTKLALMGLQTESELDKEVSEIAKKNISLALAIEKIQDELKIEIDEKDVEEYLAKLAKVHGTTLDKIKEMTKNNQDWIHVNISQRKTYDKLMEINKK